MRLLRIVTLLSVNGWLACSSADTTPNASSGGTSNTSSVVGGATFGGNASLGGASNVSSGTKATGGNASLGGTSSVAGGTKATGGNASLGGTSSVGGSTKATGGNASLGGTSSVGGGTKATGGNASLGGTSSVGGGTTTVTVNGKQLQVNGKPFRIRGVCYNPIPKGKNHPDGIDFVGLVPTDIPLMKAANVNVVRTYEPLTNTAVLDQFAAAGIYVINSVYPYGGDAASVVTARVNAVKNHRAILMWSIGNEWNYNGLYVSMSAADAQARLNEVATLIRAADTTHPIATVYGEVPSKAVVDGMPNVQVWGINSYRGISFGDLFTKWQAVSSKPLFIAEYGADAYNAKTNQYDPTSQAEATRALTQEITAQAVDVNAAGTVIGGTIFEWADEWWKDSSGSLTVHDVGGIAPGGGPYPDSTFNEEWWGVVDVDRAPRPAYDALKQEYAK
jgi:hypothetical protein